MFGFHQLIAFQETWNGNFTVMFLLWYLVYSLQAVRYSNGDIETILRTWQQCCHDFSLSPHNILTCNVGFEEREKSLYSKQQI